MDDWETYKKYARLVYARVSELLIFLQLVFYLWGCAVAMKPLGPKDYVSFAYHCVLWTPGKATAGAQDSSLKEH